MANNKNKNNKKNVGKICFENERSALITKIENTTGGWKFFGYMYNTAMFRTLLLELMMIIFVIPAVIIIFLASSKILGLSQNQIGRASCRERLCLSVYISVVAV